MTVIKRELTQTDIIGSKDATEKDFVLPPNTIILELENRPPKFDARDMREYVEKYLGKNILELDDGVLISSDRVVVMSLKAGVDKEAVKTKLEEMFAKPLADVRDETGREVKRRIDGRI